MILKEDSWLEYFIDFVIGTVERLQITLFHYTIYLKRFLSTVNYRFYSSITTNAYDSYDF